ncbi:Maf family protein [Pararobbsia silviterrae]|uniref:dTTP/UTP pyrophosphatase n=1 Tax=Pararobbsia silviterrae TaxID=1792498 RepID=A0A494Y4Q3_9BURK|nr:Maf family protein [Pararobbsia silviterrae]RKP56483.1 septum formation inhibitor Maf [Pararobbsia silviterrae]
MQPTPAPSAFIYLASQSPRRRELLGQIGVRFELLLPDDPAAAEALEAERPGESARDYVVRVCEAKASAAFERLRASPLASAPILTADTTVTVDGAILGKPADAAHAADMLARLAGREHQVLTAVAVGGTHGVHAALSISTVRFAPMRAAQIDAYVASGEPFGKAGAYGIQGRAAEFVAQIEGSYSGIMGLPLYETAALLRAARVEF